MPVAKVAQKLSAVYHMKKPNTGANISNNKQQQSTVQPLPSIKPIVSISTASGDQGV
jgi:hypothetical protein